jgi:predicted nucleic acid-binding protein
VNVYADSSFFVSIYLPDVHSPEALRRMGSHPRIWLTPFHEAELASAIAQQVFRGIALPADADRTFRNVAKNRDTWIQIGFPETAFKTAIKLARTHVSRLGTRTLDSLHVASALELGAQQFWTFDERQAKLAKAVGLKVS